MSICEPYEAVQNRTEIWSKIYKIIDSVKKHYQGSDILKELGILDLLFARYAYLLINNNID